MKYIKLFEEYRIVNGNFTTNEISPYKNDVLKEIGISEKDINIFLKNIETEIRKENPDFKFIYELQYIKGKNDTFHDILIYVYVDYERHHNYIIRKFNNGNYRIMYGKGLGTDYEESYESSIEDIFEYIKNNELEIFT